MIQGSLKAVTKDLVTLTVATEETNIKNETNNHLYNGKLIFTNIILL